MREHDEEPRYGEHVKPVEELKEAFVAHERHREYNDHDEHERQNDTRRKADVYLARKQPVPVVQIVRLAHIIQVDQVGQRVQNGLD